MEKTWKEKANELGIELTPVKNDEGEIIETQFDFLYKGMPCKTWIDKDNHRAYARKKNIEDYYPNGKYTNDFQYFIDEFDTFA